MFFIYTIVVLVRYKFSFCTNLLSSIVNCPVVNDILCCGTFGSRAFRSAGSRFQGLRSRIY